MVSKLKAVLLIWISFSVFCLAQTDDKLVEYSPDFTFKEGLYLTFNAWKQNDPIAIRDIVTDFDPKSKRFFINLLSKRYVTYFDGKRNREIESKEFFGYSRGKKIYTVDHYPIQIIGSICHYTVDLNKTARQQLTRYAFFGIFARTNTEQLKSYIIDFEKNSSYHFNTKSIEFIIKRDKELYKKYKKDRRRKKTKMHQYLLEYNERNPLYFPK